MSRYDSLPSTALARFDRYGLPGLVIGALLMIDGLLTYYGFTVIINNTKAMVGVESAVRDFSAELKERH